MATTFELRHRLPGSPALAYSEIFSEAYDEAIASRSQMRTRKLEDSVTDSGRFLRSEVTSARSLPKPISKILGTAHLSYILEQKLFDDLHRVEWKIIPSKMADRIKADGSYTLRSVDNPNACERLITGKVSVSIPMVGKKIEQIVCDQVKSSYEDCTEFVTEWLRSRNASTADRPSG